MKIALIFTNDWELFGDGSGDYFEVQHQPMLDLLKLFGHYGARMTIMAETAQQFAHMKLVDSDPRAADVVNAWEKLVINAVAEGHDVQLHYHPQWEGARFEQNKWKLSENWSIARHPPEMINKFISDGKSYLEGLIKPDNPGYNCNVFRAGAYYIEPSGPVIDVLKNNGFRCDTSVTKGLVSPGHFDFSEAYSNLLPWHTSAENITKKGKENEGVLEMPIYSFRGLDSDVLRKFFPGLYYRMKYGIAPDVKELKWAETRDQVKNMRYPVENRLYKKVKKRGVAWYARAILSKKYTQLDYDYLPASVFVKILEKVFHDKETKGMPPDAVIPVVASGHVKDMHSTENIKKILDIIGSKLEDKVVYMTLSDAMRFWLGEVGG